MAVDVTFLQLLGSVSFETWYNLAVRCHLRRYHLLPESFEVAVQSFAVILFTAAYVIYDFSVLLERWIYPLEISFWP